MVEEMMRRVVRQVAGWFFIVLGIVGLFLPILQGVLFILLGMIVLARDVPLFHRMLVRLEARYPALFAKAHKMHLDIVNWSRRMVARVGKCVQFRVRGGGTGTGE